MDQVVFCCQECRSLLTMSGLEPAAGGERAGSQAQSLPTSVSNSSSNAPSTTEGGLRVEESFVLLEDKKGQRPSAGTYRTMDESFVVLGPASLTKHQQWSQQPPGEPSAGANFESKVRAFAKIFELASEETGVDHPLCIDCASQVRLEVENQKKEIEAEIAEYTAAVQLLEKEEGEAASLDELSKEIELARQECENERIRAEKMEADLREAEKELAQLEAIAEEMDELEERYWHDFNDYHLQLQAHVEEKAALVKKSNQAKERLDWLKQLNVYSDAFKISHDGPFGAISGFRMGRTSDIKVDWDEINCAWGQAVLLLHTMAQACGCTFSNYHLVPLGSRPKIIEKEQKGGDGKSYELFGPVPKLFCWSYDGGMVCYLACLKEFADFAHQKDLAEGKEETFLLPFSIEGDKVNNMTIKSAFNTSAKWTKALKYMLANLHACMTWLVEWEARQSRRRQGLGHDGSEPRRSRS
ncbi:hypothetical protein BSKO_06045 [Bryopsis sp. KO-2023]|nr:hypothetical protein BSKO_06045 [Bryopsis sp. KO-2023]